MDSVPHGWGGLTIMVEGERHVLQGGRQERMRPKQKRKPLIKSLDLVRLIHYHKNSMRETAAMIQLCPPGPALGTWGLLQSKGKFGWENRAKHSQFPPPAPGNH